MSFLRFTQDMFSSVILSAAKNLLCDECYHKQEWSTKHKQTTIIIL
jgi:hypothetical protein